MMRWLCMIQVLYLSTLTSGDQPKIIIVGAGAAGIAAASRLFENGFQNVTILEAEDRIGGRVHTVWFHESWIDLGGQWVHGQVDNIVYQLASPLGVLEVPQGDDYMDFTVYNSKGCRLPDSVGSNLIAYFLENLDIPEDATKNNGSVGEYFQRIMNIELKKYPTISESLGKEFMKLFEGLLMASEASDNWHQVSLRGQAEGWSCPGSNVVNWKDRGYSTILDILTKKYPNPEEELAVLNNTLLNSEVVSVNYRSTEGKAVVETSDGKRYMADHVIMTPSLGVLKEKYETLFAPRLPETKVKAIENLGFGTVAKIYLFFDASWWPGDFPHNAFVWDETDRREYEKDSNTKWLVDIVGIFPVIHKPRVLYAWLSGASARYMETLPEHQVLNQTMALVYKFLGQSYNVTRPAAMKRTTWHSDDHFRGSYSFRSTQSERADVWPDQLADPISVNGKPIVMFAGEATHSHYFGNVHGAIETGFREATRLMDIYRNTTMRDEKS